MSFSQADTTSRNVAPSGIRRLYMSLVTVAGLLLCLVAVARLSPRDVSSMGLPFLVVAVLLLLAELRPLIMPDTSDANGVTTSTAFVFALLIAFGLAPALLLQTVGTVVSDRLHRRAWWRTAFNAAQYDLSWGAATAVLWLLGDRPTATHPLHLDGHHLPAVVLAAAAYFAVNNLLVSQAVAFLEHCTLRAAFFDDFGYQVASNGSVLALSPLVVVVMQRSAWLVPLFLFPLFAVYATAAISLEKEHQAHHDALTGLPNRKLLLTRAREALVDAARNDGRVALCLLDLDRFKEVNDTLGHQVGDGLLQLVAGRISDVLRPGDTVARLGGDEFAVLLPGVRDADSALEVALRISASLDRPLDHEGMCFDLEGSVGVALFPDHGRDFEALMRRADVAMYLAKESGSGVEVYVPQRDHNSAMRLALLGEIRRAVEIGELELHYQPKARLTDGAVTGVEALVRWRHPQRGLLRPDEFVPGVEQSALMRVLTQYVLEVALRQVAAWRECGLRIQVAVNVSVRDLHDATLADFLADRLRHFGLPGSALQLEITEHILMADATRAASTLRAFAALGVELSLDDFGTGYSSLVHLKRLPVSEIKIDRSFVQRMDVSEEDAAIVRSIVDLGHGLGLRVVAEGVETAGAWARLAALGCHYAQGWYLAKAMPATEATSWLERRAAAATLPTRRLAVVPASGPDQATA